MRYGNPYKIALAYVIFGILWILLSDYTIEFFELFNIYLFKSQTIKGIIFVIFSALLIYFLINKNFKQIIDYKNTIEQNEKGLRSILDSIGDAVIATDTNGKVVRINPVAQGLTGWSLEEALDKEVDKVLNIINSQNRQAYDTPIKNVLYTGKTKDFAKQTLLLSRNGKEYHITCSVSPIKDYLDEKIIGTVLVFRDETEKFCQEEALRKSELRLQTLMSDLPGMAYRCYNSFKWPMTFVSQGCIDLLGITSKDLTSKNNCGYSELIHPDDRQAVWEYIQKRIDQKRDFQLEYRIQNRDGKEKWVWEQGQAVDTDSEGRIILEGFITDITDRKKAEERMHESEEKFKKLFNTSPDALALVNEDGKFLTVNPSMAKNFDLNHKELEGKYFHDVIPDDVANKRVEKGKEAIETERTVFFEDEREGMYFQNYYVPISSYHKKRTFQCIARNITSRKQTENRLQKTLIKLNQSVKGTFQVLSSALEQRDPYTSGHQKRVTE
ncbi:MAG TPA: PAS domain S-box protein, partial [Desulfohalobiaceae bacterium]|nr:PAS domain S-box protein [Desulfohalobiaceae bacterium]